MYSKMARGESEYPRPEKVQNTIRLGSVGMPLVCRRKVTSRYLKSICRTSRRAGGHTFTKSYSKIFTRCFKDMAYTSAGSRCFRRCWGIRWSRNRVMSPVLSFWAVSM